MVLRSINIPVGKVGIHKVFWMHQVKTGKWFCRSCGIQQEREAMAFEMTTTFSKRRTIGGVPIQEWQEKIESPLRMPVKLYLCMACAEKVLEEAVEQVKICRNVGPEGYAVMRSL